MRMTVEYSDESVKRLGHFMMAAFRGQDLSLMPQQLLEAIVRSMLSQLHIEALEAEQKEKLEERQRLEEIRQQFYREQLERDSAKAEQIASKS